MVEIGRPWADVDPGRLGITDMRGLKRTVRKFERCLGHRAGFGGDELLDYLAARKQIYLPAYEYVLRERLADELARQRSVQAEEAVPEGA